MTDSRRMPEDEREAYRLDAQLLSDLWFFRAAARGGAITAAAQQLNVTQGAVSQRVLRLEGRLGTELFHRHKGKIVLTAAGEILLEGMNAATGELNRALGRIDPSRRSALVVSCSPSMATEWLMPHLQDFYRECPQVELVVRSEMVVPSLQWMQEERVDVLIDYLHADVPELEELAAVQELTFPVCSPPFRHRLDGLPEKERAVVLMHDDAAWGEGEADGAEWQEWLNAAGGRRGFVVEGERHFNLAYLTYQAAVYGQGLAMGRSISVNRLLRGGDLVAATDVAPLPSAFYRVFAVPARAADSPAGRFAAWIRQAMLRTQQETLELLGISISIDANRNDALPRGGEEA